jgi:hypothetical protein
MRFESEGLVDSLGSPDTTVAPFKSASEINDFVLLAPAEVTKRGDGFDGPNVAFVHSFSSAIN